MRMMIVDDNKQIREGIHFGIPWADYGFEEIGEFADGKDALQMISAFRPDIIIADIRMPNMDGLELLETIRRKGYTCKYILLSAYSEFSYAQKAISHGADDYILKPVKPAKLIEVVMKSARDLLRQQKERNAYYDIYEKSMIHALITGADFEDGDKLKRVFEERYGFVLMDNQIFLSILCIERADGKLQKKPLPMGILQEVRESLKKEGLVFWLKENQMLFIGRGNVSLLISINQQHQLKNRIDILNHRLIEENLAITLGISESRGVNQIAQSYRQAEEALERTYSEQAGSCMLYGQIAAFKTTFSRERQKEYEEKILYSLQKREWKEFQESLETLRMETRKYHYKRSEISDFLRKICNHMEKRAGIESDQELERRIQEEATHLDSSLWELESYVGDYLNKKEKPGESEHFSSMIRNICAYMDEHFKEPISVDSVATVFGRTPNYVSSKFKKEVGKSFTDYLIELRIQKAITLLKYTAVPIHEVAQEVGFSSYAYFSRTFRKYTGKNAGVYRENKE